MSMVPRRMSVSCGVPVCPAGPAMPTAKAMSAVARVFTVIVGAAIYTPVQPFLKADSCRKITAASLSELWQVLGGPAQTKEGQAYA